MKRFFPRIAALALALILFGTGIPCAAVTDEAPEIGAEYAVIFNADDGGEILYGKNETKELARMRPQPFPTWKIFAAR